MIDGKVVRGFLRVFDKVAADDRKLWIFFSTKWSCGRGEKSISIIVSETRPAGDAP